MRTAPEHCRKLVSGRCGINVTRGGRGGRNRVPHLRAALGLRARAPSFVSMTHGQSL